MVPLRYRASPRFALVAHGALPPPQRAAFDALRGRDGYWGLLLPQGDAPLSAKTVDRGTARLLRTLRQGRTLPAAAPQQRQALHQLVLDGVLEVDAGQGYVGGARAATTLDTGTAAAAPAPATGALQALSLQALAMAAALPALPPLALGAWLYRHHTLPDGPRWQRLLPACDDMRRTLGLDARCATGRELARHYDELPHPAWHVWLQLGPAQAGTLPALPFKLYVSLHPQALAQALPLAVRALVQARVPAFKLIRGARGLLRPDKLIAYLPDPATLQALAHHLTGALRGARAQGVPFTCALDDQGLLSWGSDPADGHRLLDWQRVESWRSLITRRLGFALAQARDEGLAPAAAVHFALQRLQLEGVDTRTWAPAGKDDA